MERSLSTHVIVLAPAELYRHTWHALLTQQPYIEIAQTACHVEVIPSLLADYPAATILIDLPNDELPTIHRLLSSSHTNHLLIVTDDYDLDTILPLLKAGAIGFIARADSVTNLARAILAVSKGEIALPPSVAGKALTALATGDYPQIDAVEPLTDREREVLIYLASGMTNKDIAQTLFLSVRTIEAHLRSIYGKLNISSRTEATLWAVRNGYAPSN